MHENEQTENEHANTTPNPEQPPLTQKGERLDRLGPVFRRYVETLPGQTTAVASEVNLFKEFLEAVPTATALLDMASPEASSAATPRRLRDLQGLCRRRGLEDDPASAMEHAYTTFRTAALARLSHYKKMTQKPNGDNRQTNGE